MMLTNLTYGKPFQSGKGARQSGIALIEVLVAVLVLGVGLLGIAAMQSVSSQMTNGAEQRTQAILLSADILDRIRANKDNIASYDNMSVNPGNDLNCATGFEYNNGQPIAVNDINEWSNQIVCVLPQGQATVNVNAGVVTVRVDWQRQDPDGQAVTVRTQL